jgi:hypothetical protein
MKLRIAKKQTKKFIRENNLKIIKTTGRTFIVKPKPNFLCHRNYTFIVVAENHPKLIELQKEGKLSIEKWKMKNKYEYEQRQQTLLQGTQKSNKKKRKEKTSEISKTTTKRKFK